MSDFRYRDPFPLAEDNTSYRLLTKDYVSVTELNGREILEIDPAALTHLARAAMQDLSLIHI